MRPVFIAWQSTRNRNGRTLKGLSDMKSIAKRLLRAYKAKLIDLRLSRRRLRRPKKQPPPPE